MGSARIFQKVNFAKNQQMSKNHEKFPSIYKRAILQHVIWMHIWFYIFDFGLCDITKPKKMIVSMYFNLELVRGILSVHSPWPKLTKVRKSLGLLIAVPSISSHKFT